MSWRDVVLRAQGRHQWPIIQWVLDNMPHEAGQLFRFLIFLGSDSIPARLFEAAAKSVDMQDGVRQNLVPPLKPFFNVTENKWDDKTFENATSYLVQEQFLTYTTGDQKCFTVDQKLRTRTLKTLDHEYKRNLGGWVIALVSMAGSEDPQAVTLRQLYHCCELAHRFITGLEENGRQFEFLSLWCTRLAEVCQVREAYSTAEELYTLSIGSGVGAKNWKAKFCLAVIRTAYLNKWSEAEAGIRDATSQGLPDEATLGSCTQGLCNLLREWVLSREGKDSELNNLKALLKIVYHEMKLRGRVK